MIELYTWSTPNGRKISIALEEMGLPYEVHPIDIDHGQQFAPEFLAISPNNKIPAIVDRDNGMSLMESGAILLYLADKTGKLIPPEGAARWHVIEWLMWQMGGLGPMIGQAHHFLHDHPDASDYAAKRYAGEAQRLYRVLDRQLADKSHIAGAYSIADIAAWPWVSRFERHRVDLNDFPNVRRWYVELAGRPAMQRGYQVPRPAGHIPMPR